MRELLRGSHAAITWGLVTCGVAWGLANFGFLLWLPTNLGRMGMDASAASALLARSAVIALPGTALVIWMYHRWSSLKSLVAFIVLNALSLLLFFALGLAHVQSPAAMVGATALLLVSASGVIAMLIPYSAEIYPGHLRGTGSGLVAAGSKFGGILGALGGVFGLFSHFALSALRDRGAHRIGCGDADEERRRNPRPPAGGHPARAGRAAPLAGRTNQPSNCGCSCRMRVIAMPAAAVRVSTPSLANTRSRCFFTVARAGAQDVADVAVDLALDHPVQHLGLARP